MNSNHNDPRLLVWDIVTFSDGFPVTAVTAVTTISKGSHEHVAEIGIEARVRVLEETYRSSSHCLRWRARVYRTVAGCQA
jgi:hypothetical protein